MLDTCVIYHESKDGKAFVCKRSKLGENWYKHYFPGVNPEKVVLRPLDGVAGNLFYSEMLAGTDGMSFTLFQEENHTAEDVQTAKDELRRQRDVVGIHVVKVNFAD